MDYPLVPMKQYILGEREKRILRASGTGFHIPWQYCFYHILQDIISASPHLPRFIMEDA